MNYRETTEWMFAKVPMYQRVGASAYKPGLESTKSFFDILGNPQDSFKTIHVAGTNGKGSCSHSIASVFQEAGYKTGLYTSPHLRDFRERIRVNGEMITEEAVVDFIGNYKDTIENKELSFFEMATGMAFDYFKKEKVDIAIIEVGMGGRLDATNIIRPELSIITNISLDHIQFLGNTLEKIAVEKAGIIKEGVPVVIGETQNETKPVFINKAKETNSPIFFADAIIDCDRIHTNNTDYQSFDVWKNSTLLFEDLHYPLLGIYQKKNLSTIICALDVLKDKFDLSEKVVRDGLMTLVEKTHLSGRWQVLGKKPLVIADTGHNVGGIKETVMQFGEMNYRKLHIVIGMVNDKDVSGVLSLLPSYAEYYFCKADSPRGLDAGTLAEIAFSAGLRGSVYESVRQAYNSALNNAHPDDVVFVGGSNFVVAEII